MPIIEDAVRAYREQRDRPWTRSMEWDKENLKTALKETLGINVDPTAQEIEIEGLTFSTHGTKLLHVRGSDGLDHPVLGWEDLGSLIEVLGMHQNKGSNE